MLQLEGILRDHQLGQSTHFTGEETKGKLTHPGPIGLLTLRFLIIF